MNLDVNLDVVVGLNRGLVFRIGVMIHTPEYNGQGFLSSPKTKHSNNTNVFESLNDWRK